MSRASKEQLARRDSARWLRAQRERLAQLVVAWEFERHPELETRWGAAGREHCLADARRHLTYLAEAVESGSYPLWRAYVGWCKTVLHALRIGEDDLVRHLRTMAEVLNEKAPKEARTLSADPIERALGELKSLPREPPTHLADGTRHEALARCYLESLLARRHHDAERLIAAAVRRSVTIADLYLHVFQPVQREVGRLWQMNRVDVGLEHYCTAATQRIMAQLYPLVFAAKTGDQPRPRVAIACVSGELHELGARMVADLLELDGFDTLYFGANVPTKAMVRRLADEDVELLGVSATIATHVDQVRRLIAAVRAEPGGKTIKIMVGGYAFLLAGDFWRSTGADAFAPDGEAAIAQARRLLAQQPP